VTDIPFLTRVADGAYGPIEGAAADAVVFGRYESEGTWSSELVGLLAGLLAGGGTLLDVGAHIGLVTIGVARSCPAARCLAFEPAPDNHGLLLRNLARQQLRNRVEPFAVALDAQSGAAELALSADNSGDHRLLRHARARSERSVQVRCARLDDLLAGRELAAPIVLKLDTQGAELRVLAGARASLSRVDHLVLEYWPFGLHRMGERAASLHELLCAHFAWGTVLIGGNAPAPFRPIGELLAALGNFVRDDGAEQGFFDLWLSKRERP
jgi:FkbM family methyltransferase